MAALIYSEKEQSWTKFPLLWAQNAFLQHRRHGNDEKVTFCRKFFTGDGFLIGHGSNLIFLLTKTIHIDDELKSAKTPTLGSNPAAFNRPSRVITQPIWCEGAKLRQQCGYKSLAVSTFTGLLKHCIGHIFN